MAVTSDKFPDAKRQVSPRVVAAAVAVLLVVVGFMAYRSLSPSPAQPATEIKDPMSIEEALQREQAKPK